VSLFRKITLLFSASLLLMLAIGYQMERLNAEKTEVVVTQRYLQDARKLFVLMATAETGKLEEELSAMQLVHTDAAAAEHAQIITEQPHSFGGLKILKNGDGDYLLQIRYMETLLLLRSTALQQSLKEEWLPKTLVGLDIALLVAIFLIILAILAPLRRIAETMRAFAGGAFESRTDVRSNDEIGEVAATYNEMAQRLEDLIAARTELLRNIGHELRTPIARGLFVLEKMPPGDTKHQLQRCFTELERQTSELLQIEKLEATGTLKQERFDAETLILQALSKTMADEEKVTLEIRDNFTLEGDCDYLALALKNLIDNALKYAADYPVLVTASERDICVQNRGEPLGREIGHYLQPFSREPRSSRGEGFGLGLSIVTRVLERHGLRLAYDYDEGTHRFCIRF
jgi:two-component system OmpR family sensor kinase